MAVPSYEALMRPTLETFLSRASNSSGSLWTWWRTAKG